MKIALYGLGYVGSVTAAMLAKAGHAVTGIDTNSLKVDLINKGESPVNEPCLADLIRDQVMQGRLTAIKRDENSCNSDVIFICVGTPSRGDGALDDSQVRRVVEEIVANRSKSDDPLTILNRSTCLPDTHLWANRIFRENSDLNTNYVVHPEFLREGSALSDFQSPPLLLFGTDDKNLDLESLSKELYPNNCMPVHKVGIVEASVAKYASNAFHAMKVTFANEIGSICNIVGADARSVMEILCEDNVLNISRAYLRPGMPYGGSCLPKDVKALVNFAIKAKITPKMLNSLDLSNEQQVQSLCDRVLAKNPTSVALLGISFKEGTDDLRGSPLVIIARRLIDEGVNVRVYDPNIHTEKFTGANLALLYSLIPELQHMSSDNLPEAISGSDIVILAHRNLLPKLREQGTTSGSLIIDLVGICEDDMRLLGDVEGLYW
ncbi:MAG: nucleotide sugar dehydrogenase [Chloroflexota bacterium]|nr:nucleotide sugar dehydrogenase [Chloroflexota bacterium]